MQSANNSIDFKTIIDRLRERFPNAPTDILIIVSISEQKLFLFKNNTLLKDYRISSAIAGIGNRSRSFKTPLGVHQIAEKIGHNAKVASIFKARINTHEIAQILIDANASSKNDIITSRILWLDGLEEGINKGKDIDSHTRYIYIHGTNEENLLGKPASHGCIRMGNQAVIDLFEQVATGTLVNIIE